MDLVDFLLARITEDEATARAATPGPWHALDGGVTSFDDESWPVVSTETDRERADRVHIAAWDPARVLAECAAKRAIVEECRGWLAAFERTDVWGGWPDIASKQHAETILELFVQPYAAHPDFRPEWAATG